LHTVARVDGSILWANATLLFWLSLVPAATAWLGQQTSGSSKWNPQLAHAAEGRCETTDEERDPLNDDFHFIGCGERI
jgi:hypothetical protein